MLSENMIPANEFCVHHNIEVSFIYSLEEYGLIETTVLDGDRFIDATQVGELEKLVRLHYDLNINLEGIDVIKYLLQQLNHMDHEITELKNKLRFYERE
jgi:hypothetical protein